jgi:hypothetical protein
MATVVARIADLGQTNPILRRGSKMSDDSENALDMSCIRGDGPKVGGAYSLDLLPA